jgi:hypothetical protein
MEVIEARGFILPDGFNDKPTDYEEEQEPEIAESIEA